MQAPGQEGGGRIVSQRSQSGSLARGPATGGGESLHDSRTRGCPNSGHDGGSLVEWREEFTALATCGPSDPPAA